MQKRVGLGRNGKGRRGGRRCISLIVLAVVIVLAVQIVQLHSKNEEYRHTQEELEAERQAQEERAEALEEERDYVGTDSYVEETARSKLGMLYDDEIVFKEE